MCDGNINIKTEEYVDTLESRYLDYSMSVIVDRAIPDIRDGLKPVQRRIIYAMDDINANSNLNYKKTARVSGEVIGKYHPHGNAGVEDAIVTMAQTFKKPNTLIDGQGNFGSIEGDGAAAARYTEVRLTDFAEDVYLSFLNDTIIDYQPNYDNTLKEPSILPGIIPMVLLTGAEGIAVGMKTNIPTFNLSEVIDANIYVLTHKKIKVENILSLLPGPDFATGGIICNKSDMKEIYQTGSGNIRMRGKVSVGEDRKHKKIIIEEIPYTLVGTAMIKFMQEVIDLVESGYLSDVVDVIDQTSETARIVIELNKNADINSVLNILYSKTKLESNMSVNLLVIDGGIPKTLGMVELFQSYITFQKDIFRKKYEYELSVLNKEKLSLDAEITALNNIDEVTSIIKSSEDTAIAKEELCNRFNLTEEQASVILRIRLSKLVSMEASKLVKDLEEVNKNISEYSLLLEDDTKFIHSIVSELKKIQKKYSSPRKTAVQDIKLTQYLDVTKSATDVYVLIDRFMYAHTINMNTYTRNKEIIESEFVYNILTDTDSKIFFFSDNGLVHKVKVNDIPQGALRDKGIPLDVLTDNKFSTKEDTLKFVSSEKDIDNIIIISSKGYGKRLNSEDYDSSRKTVSYTIDYPSSREEDKNDDSVAYVGYNVSKYIQFISNMNRYYVISTDDIPSKSRNSKGVKLIKLKSKEDKIKYIIPTSDIESSECGQIGYSGTRKSKKEIDELLQEKEY